MFSVGLFTPEQVAQLDPHEIYYGSFAVLKAQAEAIYSSPNCYTVSLYLDGRVEGVIGLAVMWPGNADCWTILSKKACKYPLALQKVVLRIMTQYARGLKLRRLSAGTDASFRQGGRWLESLGFQHEGTMRKYGPDGSDWHLYARTF